MGVIEAILVTIISTLIIVYILNPVFKLILYKLTYGRFSGFFKTLILKFSAIGVFYKKKGLTNSLRWEYRFEKENSNVYCYRSEIVQIKESVFGQVTGVVHRKINGIKVNNFFKGHYLSSDKILMWDESFVVNKNEYFLKGAYNILFGTREYVGLLTNINNGSVSVNVTFISASSVSYSSVGHLLDENPILKEQLEKINLLEGVENKIIA